MMSPLRRIPRVVVMLVAFLVGCAEPTMERPDAAQAKAPAGLTVTATDPDSAERDTTMDVRVLGSGFDVGSRADFLLAGAPDPGVLTNSTRYVSTRELVANVTIAANAIPSGRDVMVTTSTGKKGIGSEKFFVLSVERLAGSGGGFANGVSSAGLSVGRIGSGCNGQMPATWDAAGVLAYLPLPPEGCSGWAKAVNSSGAIVGDVRTDPLDAGRWTVVIWTPSDAGYVAEFLGFWSDGTNIEASDIDASGNIVASQFGGGTSRALWRAPGGSWVVLPVPAGGNGCIASGLNDIGQIAGACYFAGIRSAVLWPDPVSAPTVLPRLAGYNNRNSAIDVSNQGEVVGEAWNRTKNGSIQEMAARWTLVGGAWQVEALGHLGGGVSAARGIDENGAIVGWSRTGGANGPLAAFLWSPGGGMVNLGSLGSESQGLGVATSSTLGRFIVGGSLIQGSWRPVRWRQ